MSLWWLMLACGTAPAPVPAVEGTPRTVGAIARRLLVLGVDDPACEGGALGDEVSLACTGRLDGRGVTVDAVTTGAALPTSPGAAGAMVEDLWVEVRVEGAQGPDEAMARRLLERYAGPEASP